MESIASKTDISVIVNQVELRNVIQRALEEDLGFGDLTSAFFMPDDNSSGTFTAKGRGVLSGLGIISETYRQLDEEIRVTFNKKDGGFVTEGEDIAIVTGPTATLLSGERVILNLLQHLCGIATETNKAVEALKGTYTRVCDTRKTLPGLRMLQKYAVRCGGGYNHRYRLDSGAMIKDNHITAAGSIREAVKRLRKQVGPMVTIEVETETAEQVQEAVDSGADIIMFDNRSPEEVKQFVELVPEHITTEVSGGITIDTISNYRDTGVDYISMGGLTHSVIALDISFDLNR